MKMNLAKQKCVPCEDKSIKPMTRKDAIVFLKETPKWKLAPNAKKISRTWLFPDFAKALKFINAVGKIAEKEAHHPEISNSYNKVTLELFTHSIGGLSENDFILASKIDLL